MVDVAKRRLVDATVAAERAHEEVVRNELQASLSALEAQVQVARDTVDTLVEHMDIAQPPLPPADSEAAVDEAAAAAAEATAGVASAFLAGVLDQ